MSTNWKKQQHLLNQNGGFRSVSPTSTTTNNTLSYPHDR